jgi:hypothetical protein
MNKTARTQPVWTDVKTKLADYDRAALMGLIQDLYAASKDNKAFLHARFGLGGDFLKPYKDTLSRWLSPNPSSHQNFSVAKARKAIADYKKAIGQPEELAELMVFYCECAAGFSREVDLQDEGFFNALVSMFREALKTIQILPEDRRDTFMTRLNRVCQISYRLGYGVGDDMDYLLRMYESDDGSE